MPFPSGLGSSAFITLCFYILIMIKKTFLLLFAVLCCSPSLLAQKTGYWDKERATSKEIIVSARDRIIIKTEDLPTGTTEVVYRITLLDENQQMAGSLVSVLKSIPDPTGISQGSAGAVFILSKISGDDKCQYAIFSSNAAATTYQKTGSTTEACFLQETPLSKDAKRLSTDKSTCLQSNAIWFGFESKNWIMKQKIVLEVVPWVDYKLSRGWSASNRKNIIEQCKTSTMAQKMTNSDDFCVCVLDKIQNKYTYTEFQKLLKEERNKAYKDFGNSCFGESSVSNTTYADARKQASLLAKQGKHGEAITKLKMIINDGKGKVQDYNAIGTSYLLTKQYGKAIKFLQDGERLDDTELLIKLNLAHAYLLNDNYKSAKAIYKKYQNQNVTDSLSWVEKTKVDFETFYNFMN
jgi:tetratricopeptide (TPR) repeat protein